MLRTTWMIVAALLVAGGAWLVWHDAQDGARIEPTAVDGERAPALATKGKPKPVDDRQDAMDAAALAAGFASEDPEARKAAYDVAVRAAHIPFDEQLVRQMVTWLAGSDRTLVHYANVVLIRIGPAVEPLVRPLLASKDGETRFRAFVLYGQWRGRGAAELAYPPLLPLLEDPYDPLRQYAHRVVSSGVPYDPEIAAWLRERVSPGPEVAYYGPEVALARMGPKGVAHLVAMLDDSDLVLNGLGGLAVAAPESIREVLPRLAAFVRDDANEDVQVAAVRVLLRLQGDAAAALPALREALAGESYLVRSEVLGVLRQMGPGAAPALEEVLAAVGDPDPRIASRAADSLGVIQAPPERALPALRDALDGDAADHAAAALGALGADGVPVLQEALDRGDDELGYAALAGVAKLGPAGAPLVSRVVPLLRADDPALQVRAAAALGKLGAVGAPGIPGILALLHDGTLSASQTAGILLTMEGPAEQALLGELRSGQDVRVAAALEVLSAFHGHTGFALDALKPFLATEDTTRRVHAARAVEVSTWMDRGSMGASERSPRALRDRVRTLLRPLCDDQDREVGQIAQSALRNLDALDRRGR